MQFNIISIELICQSIFYDINYEFPLKMPKITVIIKSVRIKDQEVKQLNEIQPQSMNKNKNIGQILGQNMAKIDENMIENKSQFIETDKERSSQNLCFLKNNSQALAEQEINRLKEKIQNLKRIKKFLKQSQILYEQKSISQQTMKVEINLLEYQLTSLQQEQHKIQCELAENKKCNDQLRLTEIKLSKVESQHQDLLVFKQKINKQLKIKKEETSILKGKVIVLSNKIEQIKQQNQILYQQRAILTKHCQKLQESIQIENQKVQRLKKDLPAQLSASNERKINIESFQKHIYQLKKQAECQCKKIEELITQKQNCVSKQKFDVLQQCYQNLQSELNNLEQNQQQNKRLLKQNQSLTKRIEYLQNVNLQFISQKQIMLNELRKKNQLLQTQKQSYIKSIQDNQAKLFLQLQDFKEKNDKKDIKGKKKLKNKKELKQNRQLSKQEKGKQKKQQQLKQIQNNAQATGKKHYARRKKTQKRYIILIILIILLSTFFIES